jgi:hypothetical protein
VSDARGARRCFDEDPGPDDTLHERLPEIFDDRLVRFAEEVEEIIEIRTAFDPWLLAPGSWESADNPAAGVLLGIGAERHRNTSEDRIDRCSDLASRFLRNLLRQGSGTGCGWSARWSRIRGSGEALKWVAHRKSKKPFKSLT